MIGLKPEYLRSSRSHNALEAGIRKIERREWWLWTIAILITLLLTMGIVSFIAPMLRLRVEDADLGQLGTAVRALVGLVLVFDIYTVYQQLQIYRMRRRLMEREELFRLITENAADMIAVVDTKGHRLYNSPSYEKILGFTANELKATSSFEQIHPDDQPLVKEAAQEASQLGKGRRIEYRMRHKDGSWRFFESTASAIFGRDDKVEKLVIVNRDITDRRRLEEQFRQVQKMEAIGRLSGGIAHDFNNLLGVMIGYTEIMQEKIEPQNPLRNCVDEVMGAGRRAAALTRQLLAFSRQQVLEPRILDLNAIVSNMEKMLHRLIGEDVELATELSPGLYLVKADESQIDQIIMNLAVNARDAMPKGGQLTIKTRNVEIGEDFARSRSYPMNCGSYVQLSVSDTGFGMNPQTLARVFEPFFTTKEKGKGTGLGLSTVYGVVKQSGGYIEVASEVGVGTTFEIYLPRGEDSAPAKKSAEVGIAGRLPGETVLLVEDESSLKTLTRNLLELSGYSVLEARDGPDALALSRQHKEPIHLLLTDIVMPGMSGRDLAGQLAQVRPEIKVLYMSGYTGQTFGGQGTLAPGTHFLQKPFTRDSLTRKIRETLEE
ncbi:MAG: PAS domain S-box protein [Acidobacteria bacterium]|nr:PAS domain S-box protein [Acidobacteriota bacterium]